jgi:redox-sensitive bicupin YhaK (pirin superfamily)
MQRETAEAGRGGAPERIVVPKTRDLGEGFEVRRVLPAVEQRMVGPFVFLDQMGPTRLAPGKGLDVRPHPHIGLATVTYLFEGEILHRDSLGTVQPIRPGEVNWMTAGSGIAHSERSPPELRPAGPRLFGIQAWVGLPTASEEVAPGFAHHAAAALPVIEGDGVALRLIAGTLLGKSSPVEVFSPIFYADVTLADGARFELSDEHEERGAYLCEGRVAVAGDIHEPGRLLVFRRGDAVVLQGAGPARLLLLGGAPLDGHRHLWWNFVSSSKERIERAKADWKERRFPPVPGETEFIPLPETPPPPVRYP